ncbi:glycosyltransferase [Mucilaginibacter gilvus]|uniref:Glycosyltransferase n=1 Tax=Mucilaginibacter gilvus TaxID=2305909 RepID=A0A3S3VJ59_9SPHI|nr:glycosyltransferase [Mucilaginibacter gilvus]RWY49435.1 glycosyltransferase [Mucilaginibacter gilvus]
MDDKLPVSAIIVGYNEAQLLAKAMTPLRFCDELLYFDLGSKDGSVAIAEQYGAQVIHHQRVDSCEWIHEKYATKTRNNWVLITDPDEVLSDELINEIKGIFNGDLPLDNIGAITAPWLFYFKNKRLTGTNWGGVNRRVLLVHNQRFEFKGLIHLGRKIRAGYLIYNIPFTGKNFIHHYWMASYGKLIEKHRRYLRNEGEARYVNGMRTTPSEIIKQPFRSFRNSYLSARGYKDGATGIFLSLFWAWYETSAKIRNYKDQRRDGDKGI